MATEQFGKLSIRRNDQVQVIAGRDKGKVGKVLDVDGKTGRVTVEKVNLAKRHARPTQKNPHGGIIEKELSLHYSNVLLFCPKCNRGVRHGRKTVEKAAKGGKGEARQVRVRACKRCDGAIDAA